MSIQFRVRPIAAALLASSLLAAGCDNIRYTRLNTPPRPLARRPVAAVEVFAVTPPRRPHTDVGLIQVIGAKPPPSKHMDIGIDVVTPVTEEQETHEMIAALRRRAAEIGCDAIVVTSIDRPADWQYWLDSGMSHLPSVQASCVVYNDADL
jgi:hypothetical protein